MKALNSPHNFAWFVVVFLVVGFSNACSHTSENQDQTFPSSLSWSEIVHEQLALDLTHLTGPRGHDRFDLWLRHHGKGIAKDFLLARMAYRRGLEEVSKLGYGYYGKAEDARYFIARREDLGNDHKLYWMMVKVLSEKYGCFMKRRVRYGYTTHFFCKDQRQVVFWRNFGEDWVEFFGRQYDQRGREIAVNNHRIAYTGRSLDKRYQQVLARALQATGSSTSVPQIR